MNNKLINIVIFTNLLTIIVACSAGKLIRNGLVGSIDKYEILKAHNEYRNEVAIGKIPQQPGAENMLEMQWDDELAQVAQSWADRCVYSHRQDRTISRFQFGENLALEVNSEITELRDNGNEFPIRIRSWFEEYKQYTFGQEFSKNTGHYTQIIWAGTYLVGCGFAYYKGSDGSYVRFYVCNYGPAGNILGENPYIIGNPTCSKYGLKPSQYYHGLCRTGLKVSDTDNSISNDVELPGRYNPFITNFIPTTTEFYTTLKPSRQEATIPPNSKIYFTYQTTQNNPLLFRTNKPNQRPTYNPSVSQSKIHEILINSTTITPPTTVTGSIPLNSLTNKFPLVRTTYIPISTQQLPTTTIAIPFTTTEQTATPNIEHLNSYEPINNNKHMQSTTPRIYPNQFATTFNPYPFSPLPARPQILPNISQREYEAIVYNYHRTLLNDIFRRQQQRTVQTQSYLINSGPKSPYFTYKWSDLFN